MRDNATAVAQQAISESPCRSCIDRQPRQTLQQDDHRDRRQTKRSLKELLANTPSTRTVSLAASRTEGRARLCVSESFARPHAGSGADRGCLWQSVRRDMLRAFGTSRPPRKKQVYAEYGVSYPQAPGAYEVDHFIPLEIGGSNDIQELMAGARDTHAGLPSERPVRELRARAGCANGTISVAEAQSRMASDWYLYWERKSRAQQLPLLCRVPSATHRCPRRP